jgi:hypothetical protein
MATFTADEILTYFDRCEEQYEFPSMDAIYVPGAVRLTAYRDEERWAILVEILCLWLGTGGPNIETIISRLGNCVETTPVVSDDAVGGLTCLDENDEPVSIDVDEWKGWPGVTALIRGKRVPIPRDIEAYRKKGIPCKRKTPMPQSGADIMWVLLPEYREAMLATEEELRQHVPPDLPFFLSLDEWLHPNPTKDEMPSQNLTFRRLAAALVHGDPNRFIPPKRTNTQWRHWIGD